MGIVLFFFFRVSLRHRSGGLSKNENSFASFSFPLLFWGKIQRNNSFPLGWYAGRGGGRQRYSPFQPRNCAQFRLDMFSVRCSFDSVFILSHIFGSPPFSFLHTCKKKQKKHPHLHTCFMSFKNQTHPAAFFYLHIFHGAY